MLMMTGALSILLVILGPIELAFGQTAHGVLMVVKGDIQVTSSKTKATGKVKVGDKVYPEDTIMAGVDSRAKVVMSDKNILNISPNSKVVIERYENSKGENSTKNVSLSVLYGKLRTTVNQKYDGEKSKFHVKTPTAVAGVRGTDFLTSHSQATNTSKFVTFEGQVAVGSNLAANGQIANAVLVNPGEFTIASNTSAPVPPAPLPPTEVKQLKTESTSDGAPTSGTPSGGSTPKSPDGASNSPPGEGPRDVAKGGRTPASTPGSDMGPGIGDLTGAPPIPGANKGPNFAAPPMMVPIEVACPTCGLLNQMPPTIPDDTLRNATGRTQLIINVTGP